MLSMSSTDIASDGSHSPTSTKTLRRVPPPRFSVAAAAEGVSARDVPTAHEAPLPRLGMQLQRPPVGGNVSRRATMMDFASSSSGDTSWMNGKAAGQGRTRGHSPSSSVSISNAASIPMSNSLSASSAHSNGGASRSASSSTTPSPVPSRSSSPLPPIPITGRLAAFANKFSNNSSSSAQSTSKTGGYAAASTSNDGGSGGGSAREDAVNMGKSLASNIRDRGTNLVFGAAARLRKGKERATSGGLASLPESSSTSSISSMQSNFSPKLGGSSSASQRQGSGHSRSPSLLNFGMSSPGQGKTKHILGVRVPLDRKGEVFGVALGGAAARTRLATEEREIQDLPSRFAGNEESKARRREAAKYLPAIAIRCLDYLNHYGQMEEGLYRVPGSSAQISALRTVFDAGMDLDVLSTLQTRDLEPSGVASAFKLWLRELPSPLLHSLESDIDALLLEHTGSAASSGAMMQSQQAPGSPVLSMSRAGSISEGMGMSLSASTSSTASAASSGSGHSGISLEKREMIGKRIKELFTSALPVENLVLLREICYHLAHLDAHSSKTKMTFANLRLILSPTLRLSPVMLSLLVQERERIFPRPGEIGSPSAAVAKGPSSASAKKEGLPAIPSSRLSAFQISSDEKGSDSLAPPAQRGAGASNASSDFSFVSAGSSKRSSDILLNHRASWHFVDFPSTGSSASGNGKDAYLVKDDDNEEATTTPIARKFLHQRTASAGNLLDNYSFSATVGNTALSKSTSSAGSPALPSPAHHNALYVHQRTPTGSGRSTPSPFFSSIGVGGSSASHVRKRTSSSSVVSLSSRSYNGSSGPNSPGLHTPTADYPCNSAKVPAGTASGLPFSAAAMTGTRSHQSTGSTSSAGSAGKVSRRLSRQELEQHNARASHSRNGSGNSGYQDTSRSSSSSQFKNEDEEEEELCSSDTNTSISSAATPKDSLDSVEIDDRGIIVNLDGLDTRRTTITEETFRPRLGLPKDELNEGAGDRRTVIETVGSTHRLGVPQGASSTKSKRGSMMIMSLPWDSQALDGGEDGQLLSMEEQRRLFGG